jgi:hypothetical protein
VSKLNQQRLIIFLIGAATITAGVISWRVGQVGSGAAFDDRQSVGQTVAQQEQEIEVSLGLANAISTYVDYVADFSEADAIDRSAAGAASAGRDAIATTMRQSAANLRLAASSRAVDAGLFGRQNLTNDLIGDSTEPRELDIATQEALIRAEVTTGPTAQGELDPDFWAGEADSKRARMKAMRNGVFVIILSVVLLTIAQVTDRFRLRVASAGVGVLVFVITAIYTVSNHW